MVFHDISKKKYMYKPIMNKSSKIQILDKHIYY